MAMTEQAQVDSSIGKQAEENGHTEEEEAVNGHDLTSTSRQQQWQTTSESKWSRLKKNRKYITFYGIIVKTIKMDVFKVCTRLGQIYPKRLKPAQERGCK